MGLRCERCRVTALRRDGVREATCIVFDAADRSRGAIEFTVLVHGDLCGPVLSDDERFAEWRDLGEVVG